MKGKDKGKGNVPDRDDWETPQWLYDILHTQYQFNTDCCSSMENKKCVYYHEDFLNTYTPLGRCWMNPPFSKASDMIKHFFKVVRRGVVIYRCDNMETKIWQFILNNADWVHIFDKRINYEGKAGNGAVFGSALFGIGLPMPEGLGGVTIKKVGVRE